VGGIAELVSKECGRLFCPDATPRTVAEELVGLVYGPGSVQARSRARAKVEADFDAATNYPHFIRGVLGLASGAAD
jgi:hypothetical protein